jgi:1-acyl-sn-glycerol-3-phosphate acyltransferase
MAFPIVRRVLWVLLSPFIKEINGVENVPLKGPLIIAANHESYLDPFIIYHALIWRLNKKIYFLAMTGRTKLLWKIKLFDRLFRTWGAIVPLDDGKDVALKRIEVLLREGKVAGLFPGGPRAQGGCLTRGKTGAVRLALAAKAPVLPIGIRGSGKIAPGDKLIPKFKKAIVVNIGKPIYFNEFYNKKLSKKVLLDLTKKLMKEIAALTGKKYLYS